MHLVGGQKYYIEVLHKEGTIDDHLSVGWELPDDTGQMIPSSALTPFRPQIRLYAERSAAFEEGVEEGVSAADPLTFTVTVREGNGETRHEVTMSRAAHARLGGGTASPEACIRAAFAFLLDRESKESILSSFDVMVIGRYFSEFERELPRYLNEAGEEA